MEIARESLGYRLFGGGRLGELLKGVMFGEGCMEKGGRRGKGEGKEVGGWGEGREDVGYPTPPHSHHPAQSVFFSRFVFHVFLIFLFFVHVVFVFLMFLFYFMFFHFFQ